MVYKLKFKLSDNSSIGMEALFREVASIFPNEHIYCSTLLKILMAQQMHGELELKLFEEYCQPYLDYKMKIDIVDYYHSDEKETVFFFNQSGHHLLFARLLELGLLFISHQPLPILRKIYSVYGVIEELYNSSLFDEYKDLYRKIPGWSDFCLWEVIKYQNINRVKLMFVTQFYPKSKPFQIEKADKYIKWLIQNSQDPKQVESSTYEIYGLKVHQSFLEDEDLGYATISLELFKYVVKYFKKQLIEALQTTTGNGFSLTDYNLPLVQEFFKFVKDECYGREKATVYYECSDINRLIHFDSTGFNKNFTIIQFNQDLFDYIPAEKSIKMVANC